MERVTKAVVPAAGWGTRLLPITKVLPKEMLPIIDKPVIGFVIDELIQSGIDDILIITDKRKRVIEDYFDTFQELTDLLKAKGRQEDLKCLKDIESIDGLHFIRQREKLGLGHAIGLAEKHIGGNPFAVSLGDTIVINHERPLTSVLCSLYLKSAKLPVVAVEKILMSDTNKYGIVKPRERSNSNCFCIDGLVEKPNPENAPSDLAIIGNYVLPPEIFRFIKETRPGTGGEIQLTDALKRFKECMGFLFSGKRFDIGTREGYLDAIRYFAEKRKI